MLNKTREADAIIPWKEQNPRERFRQGEPIRAVLKRVEETPKGPRLILSRADPLFVAALFKLEVPEIYQGIVDIKGIAPRGRRAHQGGGDLARRVDRPGGRLRGAQGLARAGGGEELGGERIDIVPWHPDPEIFARRALAPARVAKVISDSGAHDDHGDRGRGPALAGDRPERAERAPGQSSSSAGRSTCTAAASGWSAVRTRRCSAAGSRSTRSPTSRSASWNCRSATLAALQTAGYNTFFDIIDLEREDLLRVPGLTAEDADEVLRVIDQLTVEESASESTEGAGPTNAELAEAREVAAEILGLPNPGANGGAAAEKQDREDAAS